VEQLFRDGAASQQELEAAQWRAEAATRERAAAESDLRLAEAELAGFGEFAPGDTGRAEPVVLTSPESGRVLRVFEENARVVSPGTPILEIGNPDDLEVVIEALSRDGATIQPGAAVEFDHWGGGPALSGVVRLVEPSAFTKVSALGVEEQRVNVIADLLTPPAKRPGLGDRFRVDARIVVWEATNVLVAPSGALFRQGPGWAAFVIRDGRAHRQGVSVGRANAQETQILDGLDEGDTVILYPGDRIQDDARVTPIVIEP
jgi:HlyD family secretion protein